MKAGARTLSAEEHARRSFMLGADALRRELHQWVSHDGRWLTFRAWIEVRPLLCDLHGHLCRHDMACLAEWRSAGRTSFCSSLLPCSAARTTFGFRLPHNRPNKLSTDQGC